MTVVAVATMHTFIAVAGCSITTNSALKEVGGVAAPYAAVCAQQALVQRQHEPSARDRIHSPLTAPATALAVQKSAEFRRQVLACRRTAGCANSWLAKTSCGGPSAPKRRVMTGSNTKSEEVRRNLVPQRAARPAPRDLFPAVALTAKAALATRAAAAIDADVVGIVGFGFFLVVEEERADIVGVGGTKGLVGPRGCDEGRVLGFGEKGEGGSRET